MLIPNIANRPKASLSTSTRIFWRCNVFTSADDQTSFCALGKKRSAPPAELLNAIPMEITTVRDLAIGPYPAGKVLKVLSHRL